MLFRGLINLIIRHSSFVIRHLAMSFSAIDLHGSCNREEQNHVRGQKDEPVDVGEECEGEVAGGLHTIRCITSKPKRSKDLWFSTAGDCREGREWGNLDG